MLHVDLNSQAEIIAYQRNFDDDMGLCKQGEHVCRELCDLDRLAENLGFGLLQKVV